MNKTIDHLPRQLSRTWSAFFAQHGNLTEIQRQSIEPILDGHSTLLVAATASGKTEAAVVPLIERHILPDLTGYSAQSQVQQAKATALPKGLLILYISPTRALTKDLYERLLSPCGKLKVPIAMKSGDMPYLPVKPSPKLLITTPESTDSMLTRIPRLFTTLRAIVLDEIHLFDHGPRGDHLRCLLRRIENIRRYHQRQQAKNPAQFHFRPLQRVALSATVPDPDGIAQRYLRYVEDPSDESARDTKSYKIVAVPGRRQIEATLAPMASLTDVIMELSRRSRPPLNIRKTLVFCNTRKEVEQTGRYLRQHLTYTARVFVHYSNLDTAIRQEVEHDFALAPVAICVCTTTLELGIDIGDVDDVVLIGPPPTAAAFLQRIGRGGRRTDLTRVLCLYRSPLEEVRFATLVEMAQRDDEPSRTISEPAYHFRPSVLIQQTFSILKQSPTGAIKIGDLRRAAPEPLPDETLRSIFGNLMTEGHLIAGRIGEWRPGPALDELLDEHQIYSNIGSDVKMLTVIDVFTNRVIAQVSKHSIYDNLLLMGGRTLEIVWRDGYRVGVKPSKIEAASDLLMMAAAPFAIPLDVSQSVATYLGLEPGQMCLVREANDAWLFHFWGAIYGTLLSEVLQIENSGSRPTYSNSIRRAGRFSPQERWQFDAELEADGYPESEEDDEDEQETWTDDEDGASIQAQSAFCLYLNEPTLRLPIWNSATVNQAFWRQAHRLEPFLNLGRFHSLLPLEVMDQTAHEVCDLNTFEQLYREATIVVPSAELRSRLVGLL